MEEVRKQEFKNGVGKRSDERKKQHTVSLRKKREMKRNLKRMTPRPDIVITFDELKKSYEREKTYLVLGQLFLCTDQVEYLKSIKNDISLLVRDMKKNVDALDALTKLTFTQDNFLNYTQFLMKGGFPEKALAILGNKATPEIHDKTWWCLANLCEGSDVVRNELFSAGMLGMLERYIKKGYKDIPYVLCLAFVRTGRSGQGLPSLQVTQNLCVLMEKLFFQLSQPQERDIEQLVHISDVWFSLSKSTEYLKVIASNQRLINQLIINGPRDNRLIRIVTEVLYRMSCMDEYHEQLVIKHKAIVVFSSGILTKGTWSDEIRLKCAAGLCELARDPRAYLYFTADVIDNVTHILGLVQSTKTTISAVGMFINLIRNSDQTTVGRILAKEAMIEHVCRLFLHTPAVDIQYNALCTLRHLLRLDSSKQRTKEIIEEEGCADKIENLSMSEHGFSEISKVAEQIVNFMDEGDGFGEMILESDDEQENEIFG